jgi:hypothetical protein
MDAKDTNGGQLEGADHLGPIPSRATGTSSPVSSIDAENIDRPRQWIIDVNTRYQKLVDLLISLSTGALILPPIFLQRYLGVTDEPLLAFLDGWAVGSTACFGITILAGIAFHLVSAKWVKHAWGQPIALSGRSVERILDTIFVIANLTFLSGIGLFLVFISHA